MGERRKKGDDIFNRCIFFSLQGLMFSLEEVSFFFCKMPMKNKLVISDRKLDGHSLDGI